MSRRIPIALTFDQWMVVQWAVSQQTDGNARDVSEMALCGLTRSEAKHLLAADNEIAVALAAAAPGVISFRESAIVYVMSAIVAAAPKTWDDWQSLRDSLITDPLLAEWINSAAPGHQPAFTTALMHEAEDRLPPPSQAPWKAWRTPPSPEAIARRRTRSSNSPGQDF